MPPVSVLMGLSSLITPAWTNWLMLTERMLRPAAAGHLLLNVIPIKSVSVETVEEKQLIPCGTPFGIKLFTEGVVVVGISDVQTQEGTLNPAKDSGLKIGDIILTINGEKVNTNDQVASIIENCDGEELKLTVKRIDNIKELSLTPIKSSSDNCYKAGLWIRDSSAGLGTLTFYDPQNNSN